MAKASGKSSGKPRAVRCVTSELVSFPETVFMMGGSLDVVEERIRELDTKKRLGIGNVLDATPPVWVHLDAFSIMPRMVTNGEYAEFLNHEDEEGRFYDSPELWRHVWAELGLHVQTIQRPFRASDGTVGYYEETYTACGSFVEAYLQSIYHEIQCVFLSVPEERTTSVDITPDETFEDTARSSKGRAKRGGGRPSRDQVLKRLFAFVKHRLREAMGSEDPRGADVMTDEELDLIGEYRDSRQALDDAEFIIRELLRGYGRQVDPRLQQIFKKRQVVVESVLLLERLASVVRSDPDMEGAAPIHQVIYPRRWKSPAGQAKKRRFAGTAVAWADCPVYGISFFETLAYAAWLSSLTDKALALPNEAQYERASSWPRGEPPVEGKPIKLNPRRKLLFPWQDHCPNDFKYFFGREGYEIEGYYQKDRKAYSDLIKNTARRLSDGESVTQLEGFGWHWTVDRYSDTERKYSRFSDADYPKYTTLPCIEPGGKRAEVAHYVPNRSLNDSLMVLKGSPDVIGGPGLTTRRYAAYPLRGYANIGFRLVCEER